MKNNSDLADDILSNKEWMSLLTFVVENFVHNINKANDAGKGKKLVRLLIKDIKEDIRQNAIFYTTGSVSGILGGATKKPKLAVGRVAQFCNDKLIGMFRKSSIIDKNTIAELTPLAEHGRIFKGGRPKSNKHDKAMMWIEGRMKRLGKGPKEAIDNYRETHPNDTPTIGALKAEYYRRHPEKNGQPPKTTKL